MSNYNSIDFKRKILEKSRNINTQNEGQMKEISTNHFDFSKIFWVFEYYE